MRDGLLIVTAVAGACMLWRLTRKKAKQAKNLKADLIAAAELVAGAGPGLNGLCATLKKLAASEKWPDDMTDWLCSRLRAAREPHTREYTEPVLPGLVMKCDEFDGIHMLKSARPHPQVWNLRKSSAALPIFGAGQCHLDGLLHIARHFKSQGYERIYAFNLREEPVVFLNGHACAPRLPGSLNENVDYLLAIEGHELDAMEKRLRSDCVEADRRDLSANATGAGPSGLSIYVEVEMVNTLRPWPLADGRESALSVREAYEWLNRQPGVPQVKYIRVPIADETAPDEQDFDQLVTELQDVSLSANAVPRFDLQGASPLPPCGVDTTALLFNCHMGRGRTTTGMVCCSILMEAARGWRPPEGGHTVDLPDPCAPGRDLERGEYTSILKLLEVVS
jgi:hypothetical protein